MKNIYLSTIALTALGACLAAGALTGCNPNSQAQSAPAPAAALPLEMTATAPTAIAPAPSVNALPPAPPVRVGRLANPDDTYAYADEADSENEAFGDAPPDYAVDYDGTRPWIWRGDDQSERVVEPLPGGGYRYYYYRPGAQYPYLVRDPGYTYGYDSGVLVVVYDRYGHALPPEQVQERVDPASRILARAAALYLATQQMQHQSVVAANWQARQDRIAADNAAWRQAQASQSDWAAYHAAHAPQEQAQWDQEHFRREAEAARFAQATHQPQVAQRDWQAAQQIHAQAPAGAAAPFGLHLGGPNKPAEPAAAPPPPPAPSEARPQGGFTPGGHPAGERVAPGQQASAPMSGPAAPAVAQAGPGFHGHEHGPQGAAIAPAAPATVAAPIHPNAPTAAGRPEARFAPGRPPIEAPAPHPMYTPPARAVERPAPAIVPHAAPAVVHPATVAPRPETAHAAPAHPAVVVHPAPPPPAEAKPAKLKPHPDDKRPGDNPER